MPQLGAQEGSGGSHLVQDQGLAVPGIEGQLRSPGGPSLAPAGHDNPAVGPERLGQPIGCLKGIRLRLQCMGQLLQRDVHTACP